MAEYGDHEWDIEMMSLTGIFQRFEAARLRRRDRDTALAAILAQLHNTGLMIRAPWVKHETVKPLSPSDLLSGRTATRVDEAAFRRREATRYDRRLAALIEKGLGHARDYMPTRPSRERRRFVEAASRYHPETKEARAIVQYIAEGFV